MKLKQKKKLNTWGAQVYMEWYSGELKVGLYPKPPVSPDTDILQSIKPLAFDRIQFDTASGICTVADRNRHPVVYVDSEGVPHNICDFMPYQLSLDGNAMSFRNTFQHTTIADPHSDMDKTLRLRPAKRIEGGVDDREIRIVKDFWGLPEETPVAGQKEENGYTSFFKKERRGTVFPGIETSQNKGNCRYNLTDRCVFTIDSESTWDIDDALEVVSLGNEHYLIGVHIADVSAFVKTGSPRDNDARLRATSHYLEKDVIHMLPACLSNDLCSLVEGKDRLALTVYMEVDCSGGHPRLKGIRTAKTMIRSKAKLDYESVDEYLKGDKRLNAPTAVSESVQTASRLADMIDRCSPYRDFQEPEINEEISGANAGTTIEILMISTNRIVGNLIAETLGAVGAGKHGAYVFRVQGSGTLDDWRKYFEKLQVAEAVDPDESFDQLLLAATGRITQEGLDRNISDHEQTSLLLSIINREIQARIISDTPDLDIKLSVLRRNIGRPGFITSAAYLSNQWEKTFHHGLGINQYAWFTSPIRRYPDLVNHRFIKAIPSGILPSGFLPVKELKEKITNGRKAQKALANRLSMYAACMGEGLEEAREISVRIAGFQWVSLGSFEVLGLWNENRRLRFVFRTRPEDVLINNYGLSCWIDGSIFHVGDRVLVRLTDPKVDIQPACGCIFVNDSSAFQAVATGEQS